MKKCNTDLAHDWALAQGKADDRLNDWYDEKKKRKKAEAEVERVQRELEAYEGMDRAVDYYREERDKAEAEVEQLRNLIGEIIDTVANCCDCIHRADPELDLETRAKKAAGRSVDGHNKNSLPAK